MVRLIYRLFFVSLLFASSISYAQQNDLDYSREFIYGIKKSTNGGLISGVVGKWGKVVNPKLFRTFGLEIVNVKHPKERRSDVAVVGGSYILGKSNYLYAIRGQYGYDKIIFKKAAQQGIQVNAITAIGPTIGLVAPYYVQVSVGTGVINVPYNENLTGILKSAGPLEGITESKVEPGINFKGALSFEFGAFKNSISGFEVGFMIEAFPNKIVLVENQGSNNKSIFSSVYISLIYGSRR